MQVTDEMVRVAEQAIADARAAITGSASGTVLPSDRIYAEAALTAALAEMWRPIEEYDETSGERVVLGIERNGRIEETHVGYFSWAVNDDEESLWWSEQADDEICPTHFMPLPVPPPMGRG